MGRSTLHGGAGQKMAEAGARSARRRRLAGSLCCVAALLLASASHGEPADLGPNDIDRLPAAANDAAGVRVLFVLKRQRDDLAALALAVSDPASHEYGRYRQVDALAARYGAARATIARVDAYLARFGATAAVDVTGTFSSTWLSSAQVEAIFGAHPGTFPPVPAELTGEVKGIVGTFPADRAATLGRRTPLRPSSEGAGDGSEAWPSWSMGSGTPAPCPSDDPAQCTDGFSNPGPPSAFRSFTPDQLRSAYGIASTGLTGKGRSAAVLEFGQAVLPEDVAAYTAGLGLPPLDLVQILVDGTRRPLPAGSEATLDVETIAGIAPAIDRVTLLAAYNDRDADYVTYWPMLFSMALDKRNTGGKLIDALSVSWGLACEPGIGSLDLIVDVTETIFQTAAAAGVTVAIAAGDQGSTGCLSRTPPYRGAELAVDYPGSSPWVTSVGGTRLVLAPDNTIAETQVWNDWSLQLDRALPDVQCDTPPCRPVPVWGGAGGESIVFDRPSWQQGLGVLAEGRRQVPDVAFLGDIYPATLQHFRGKWSGSGNGTSQAAPIFAAMSALLNEFGAQVGRPRIGFVAPLLYALGQQRPDVFVHSEDGDNILGNNDERFPVDCCFAHPGHDMTTGWGSLLLDRALAVLAPRRIPILPKTRLPQDPEVN